MCCLALIVSSCLCVCVQLLLRCWRKERVWRSWWNSVLRSCCCAGQISIWRKSACPYPTSLEILRCEKRVNSRFIKSDLMSETWRNSWKPALIGEWTWRFQRSRYQSSWVSFLCAGLQGVLPPARADRSRRKRRGQATGRGRHDRCLCTLSETFDFSKGTGWDILFEEAKHGE